MDDLVKMEVINNAFISTNLEIPNNMGLSLMEALKACGYDIMATCGGMALCATCHIEVLEGMDKIPEPREAELAMLDTLPVLMEGSRLSCQIRVDETLEGVKIRVLS